LEKAEVGRVIFESHHKDVDSIIRAWQRARNQEDIGGWPDQDLFGNSLGFLIVCMCKANNGLQPLEMEHIFGSLNCKHESYHFDREVEAQGAEYEMNKGMETFTVSPRPEQFTTAWGIWENQACGKVTKNQGAIAASIYTTLHPKSPYPTLLGQSAILVCKI
jgi:hypothetical protein